MNEVEARKGPPALSKNDKASGGGTTNRAPIQYFPTEFEVWNQEALSVMAFLHGRGVDVGCGRRSLHKDMVRVDIDPTVEPEHVADAAALPFEDGEFDFMWSSHNLEHTPDTLVTIAEAARVVKVGGFLVYIIPDKTYTAGRDPTHKFEWTPQEFIEKYGEIAGLQLVDFGRAAKEWSFKVVYQVLEDPHTISERHRDAKSAETPRTQRTEGEAPLTRELQTKTREVIEKGMQTFKPRDMRREPIRVSSISDHPRLTTGFGLVHRQILAGFQRALFRVSVLGTMDATPPRPGEFPYYVESVCKHDFFGYESALPFLARSGPEVLFMLGDPGTLTQRMQSMFLLGARVPVVVYFPVEGTPILPAYLSMIEAVKESRGRAVTYTEWGAKAIEEASEGKLKVDYVWHGCFAPDTLVQLPSGMQMPIKEVVARKVPQVLGLESGHVKPVTVNHWMELDMRDRYTLRITLDSGQQLRITRDNPVLTSQGWMPANNLTIGTECAILTVGIARYIGGQRRGKTLEALYQRGTGLAEGELRQVAAREDCRTSAPRMAPHSEASMGAWAGSLECNNPQEASRGETGVDAHGMGLSRRSNRGRWAFDTVQESGQDEVLSVAADGHLQPEPTIDEVAFGETAGVRAFRRRGCELGMGLSGQHQRLQGAGSTQRHSTIHDFQGSAVRHSDGVLRTQVEGEQSRAVLRGGLEGLRANEGAESPQTQAIGWAKVVQIDHDFSPTVYDLTTSSGNFIANGVVVHNCDHAPFRRYPEEERQRLRELVGWGDKFVVMNVSRNKRTNRHVAYMQAARILRDTYGVKGVLFYLHCDPRDRLAMEGMGGLDLKEQVKFYGVEEMVLFPPDLADQLHGPAYHQLRPAGWQPAVRPSSPEARAEAFMSLSMIDRYNCADAYLDASSVQGFNLPNVEAMACGLPVAATADDGPRAEVLGPAAMWMKPTAEDYWHTGARLQIVTPETIAATVLTLMKDDLGAWSKRSLERAQLFKWKACQDRFVQAIKGVVAE